jgi:hypothetical protein
VIDLDIQKFFDSVDHALMVKAVLARADVRWVVLYVKRWLTAPLALPDGTLRQRDRAPRKGPRSRRYWPVRGDPSGRRGSRVGEIGEHADDL